MMIKASNGQCPLVDEPAKIVAELRWIIAEVQRLITVKRIAIKAVPILGKVVGEPGRRARRGERVGGGFHYVAEGLQARL